MTACWRPLSTLGSLWGAAGAKREASWALLGPSGACLGRCWTHPGGVLGAPGAVWEVSWEPLEPSGTRLGSSWQRFADMLNFIVFSMVFIVFSMFLRDFTGVGSHRRAKLTQVEVHKAYVEVHMG